MDIFFQQIINGLVLGSMYALIALGYTMVYGVLNLINFAHGDVLMIGAMAGLTILKLVQGAAPQVPGIVQLIIAILGAIPGCVIVSLIIERVAYRPLRNAPRLAPLITAIGVSILLQTLAMMIWGRSPVPFPQVMSSEPLHIMGALISPTQVMLLILAFGAMAAVAKYGLPDWAPLSRSTFAAGPSDLVLGFPPSRQDRRTLPNGTEYFGVSGRITNMGKQRRAVPTLLIVLRDANNHIVYSWEVTPPKSVLAPGETIPVIEAVTDIPRAAKYAEIGWKRA